jgi:hypothetical protein
MATYRFFPPVVEENLTFDNLFLRRLHWSRGISVIRKATGGFKDHRAPLPRSEWVEGRDFFVGGHPYTGIPQEIADELVASGYEVEEE